MENQTKGPSCHIRWPQVARGQIHMQRLRHWHQALASALRIDIRLLGTEVVLPSGEMAPEGALRMSRYTFATTLKNFCDDRLGTAWVDQLVELTLTARGKQRHACCFTRSQVAKVFRS